ncbi:MAG TPA: hypothetical protein VES66_05740 [Terriglobales bacterium]|nr:hypothetical protein [Terriglobales bacterium]
MPARRTTTGKELRSYFEDWLDTAFANGLVSVRTREQALRSTIQRLRALVAALNASGAAQCRVGQATLALFLREGRDPSTGKFNLFEIRWLRRRSRRKGLPPKLRCFLGHRFTKAITRSLRHNLRHVLEPSNVQLDWSGIDLNASGFFDEIIQKIRKADFCIFDNRSASEKPNVYIEAGIAYVLEKPFILANYQGNRLGVPSDLSHILNLPYKNYRDLTKTMYFNLPVFLRDTGLRKRR